jgi:hypothetical protein
LDSQRLKLLRFRQERIKTQSLTKIATYFHLFWLDFLLYHLYVLYKRSVVIHNSVFCIKESTISLNLFANSNKVDVYASQQPIFTYFGLIFDCIICMYKRSVVIHNSALVICFYINESTISLNLFANSNKVVVYASLQKISFRQFFTYDFYISDSGQAHGFSDGFIN